MKCDVCQDTGIVECQCSGLGPGGPSACGDCQGLGEFACPDCKVGQEDLSQKLMDDRASMNGPIRRDLEC